MNDHDLSYKVNEISYMVNIEDHINAQDYLTSKRLGYSDPYYNRSKRHRGFNPNRRALSRYED